MYTILLINQYSSNQTRSYFFTINIMAKVDFLAWDTDIDLDAVLGSDYTEEYASDTDSDDAEINTRKHRKSEGCANAEYVCPVCKKGLKTITGFRGHTMNQHGLSLKASEYRDNTFEAEQKKTVPISDNYSADFKVAFAETIGNIEKDPFLDDNLVTVCAFARTCDAVRTYFCGVLLSVFCDRITVST